MKLKYNICSSIRMSGTKSVSSGIKNIKLKQNIYFDDSDNDNEENNNNSNNINPLDL